MSKTTAVSVDEFIAKRGMSSHDGIVYRAAKMPKTFNAETRSAKFVMTDETVDSYGDIVKADGADLDRFEKNPIALLNHRSDMILGTWSDIAKVGKSVQGVVTLAREGTAPHVDMAFNLMEQGILRAASIGFMPKKVERRLDDDGEPMWSYIIHEWDMYECSVVSVPANPAALAKSMKMGDTYSRDLIEEVLDTYVKTPSGLIVSREDFEAAHKEGSNNKSAHTIDFKIENTGELSEMIERMEKAADTMRRAAPELFSDEEDDIEADPIAKELELNVEEFLKDFEPKVDAIPEEETERRGILSKMLEGIRSVFKSADPEPEPEPELATDDDKNSLRERLARLAIPAE